MSIATTFIVTTFTIALAVVNAQLNECLFLINPTNSGKNVDLMLNRDSKVLPDFYKKHGPCFRVVHADSVRVNGICNNLDFHKYDIAQWKACEKAFQADQQGRKRCIWNSKTVRLGGEVNSQRVVVGNKVPVILYDKMNCKTETDSGMIKVIDSNASPKTSSSPVAAAPPSNPGISQFGKCLSLKWQTRTGKKVLFAMNVSNILEQHYKGEGVCKYFTHVSSVRIGNGPCVQYDAHTVDNNKLTYCKRYKGIYFRKCFWTKASMTGPRVMDSMYAFKQNRISVEIFKEHNCKTLLSKGNVLVEG